MPTLDSCINSVFEPGNIGSSIGTTPVVITMTSLYPSEDYNPATVDYSLDFSKFYDSMYLGIL